MTEEGRRRARAFTLLEMLVVMAIVAVLGTLTAAAFVGVSRRASREGAAEDVLGVLRQARTSALDTGRGAILRVDTSEGTLYGVASDVVAAWHLDEVDTTPSPPITPGARRMDGTILDNPAVAAGVAGLCLEFDDTNDVLDPGEPPAIIKDAVDCGQYPVYDQSDGIRLEAYVYPQGADASGQAGVMAKLDDGNRRGYALWLRRVSATGAGQYSARARVYVNDQTDEAGASEQWRLDLDSGEVLIEGHKWSHVAFEYDGFEARLYVNGVLADLDSYRLSEVGNPVPDPNTSTDKGFLDDPPALILPARGSALHHNLLIGTFYDGMSYHYFEGRIDEPRVLSVAGGRRYNAPDRVPLRATSPIIHFDDEGQLDIAHHTGPVYIALGDPFMTAELAAQLNSSDTDPFEVTPSNPFPPTGGVVMIGEGEEWELIRYYGGTDTTVGDTVDLNERGYLVTADSTHDAGEVVYFARIIEVPQNGMAGRAD
jgi:prepilin-type N-terminal cleavage/methylation domain-containing protein